MPTSWHDTDIDALAARLATDPLRGLSSREAAVRLVRDGANTLQKEEGSSPWTIPAAQFSSLVIWVLIGAALVSAALGELIDGVAIIAIVVLNAVIGFFQEYRAERAAA